MCGLGVHLCLEEQHPSPKPVLEAPTKSASPGRPENEFSGHQRCAVPHRLPEPAQEQPSSLRLAQMTKPPPCQSIRRLEDRPPKLGVKILGVLGPRQPNRSSKCLRIASQPQIHII